MHHLVVVAILSEVAYPVHPRHVLLQRGLSRLTLEEEVQPAARRQVNHHHVVHHPVPSELFRQPGLDALPRLFRFLTVVNVYHHQLRRHHRTRLTRRCRTSYEAYRRQLYLHALLALAVRHDLLSHVLPRQHLRLNLRPFHGVRFHPRNDPSFLVFPRFIHIKYHTPSAI